VLFGVVGSLAFMARLAGAAPAVESSQFVGSWVRTTPANMDGLEFTKDGKVMVYIGNGSDAMTADYSVLDDGRLNISMGGQAQFFLPSMSGDQLQLKEPVSGSVSQYRQLKSGETMVNAIAQQQQADQKLVQDRNAAVPNFLSQQDLVLVFDGGGPKMPQPSALQISPNGGGYGGRAVFDGKPLRVEQVTAQIQGDPDSPSVVMTFNTGGAANQSQMGQVTFRPVGTAPDITLTAQVNFGEMFNTGANFTAIIKPDANLHGQILDHFKAEISRLNDLKAPVLALLKDYVVLNGTSQSSLPSEKAGFTDQFTLSRNPQNQTMMGQGQVVNKTTGATDIFPVVAQVGIVNEKPAIQLQTPKRLYLFADIDTAGGKLSGAWQLPNNPNANPAELTITQAVDAKGRDQMFAANKAALMQIDSKTIFHAVIGDQYNRESQPPDVVAATLSSDANGNVSGSVVYPLENFTMTLTGKEADTPMGPQLVLKYSNGKPNTGALQDVAGYITMLQNEVWIVSPVTDAAGHLRLNGYALVNPTNRGIPPVTLQLISYTDADKTAITQALSSGTKFKVINPQGPGPDDILQFTTDADTGKIKLTLIAGGTHLNTPPGISGVGEIADQAGFAKMMAPYKRAVDHLANYGYGIFITPTDQGLYLNAYVFSTNIGAARVLGRWDALQVK
jgi:hypothetical protein